MGMSRSVICASNEGAAWLAYRGAGGSAELLGRMLGRGAETQAGAGWGLAARAGVGEPARLTCPPGGPVRTQIGTDEDAGCSATIAPDGGALTLACDPFGLHGVFYTQTGGTFWAASDPRLLQNLPGAPSGLSPAALHGYLCLSHVPTPLTMTAGVSALPAGHRLTVTAGHVQEVCGPVWREREPSPLDDEAIAGELRGLLRAAVARRLGSARDVAVFLSGGLDSSLIAALLAEAGARVHLFTLDFGPPFDTELSHARQVAAHLRRPLHVVPARPAQIRGALEASGAALSQPFGDGVVVPLYLLGQAARAHGLDTIFNGEGGDQLFGGWANKPMIAAELYRPAGGDLEAEREATYLATYHRFWGLTDQLYTPQTRAAVAGEDAGAWVRPALTADGFPSLLHRLRAANLRLKGAQNIAPRAVQLGAAHGLRVQMPFFDRALTDWTFGPPPEWFLRGACEKHGLKRAAEAFLPAEIVRREKRGMGVPTTEWCLGPLRREVGRWLSPRRLKRDGLFDPEAVARLRRGEDHAGEFRRRRVGEKLWTLLMYHVWRETHP